MAHPDTRAYKRAAFSTLGRMMDFALARQKMVDGQVRPNKVTDPRIIAAMRELPRERFVPPALAPLACVDEDVPLGNGRFLMEPMVIARLIQLLELRDGNRVLVVGAGAGYGAAVCARCDARVVALENDPDLLALGRAVLPDVAPGVVVVEGALAEGWAAAAPYDAVLVEGAMPEVPAALTAQLADGGRLAVVIRDRGPVSRATLVRKVGGSVSLLPQFDAATPLLPEFAPRPAFTF